MKKFTTINDNEPQPTECPECKTFSGYQLHDNIRLQYTYMYDADGNQDGGFYSESCKTSKRGTRAHCTNCGADLKFNVKRND